MSENDMVPDPQHEAFYLSTPEVERVRASKDGSKDPHTNWSLGYAPEREVNVNARVVYGTLHAAGLKGFGDITVSALLFDAHHAEYDEEDIEELLSTSEAVETLYDYARTSLRTVLAVVDVGIELPAKGPALEMSQLQRLDDSLDSSPSALPVSGDLEV